MISWRFRTGGHSLCCGAEKSGDRAMTAITAANAGAASVTIPVRKPAAKKGLLERFCAAFVESRMRQAQREIALHSHLLPGELQQVGERLAPRTEKDLPFIR
jgi:hypothetical protein